MNAPEELANAIQEKLSTVLSTENLHYYFGRVKAVEYPFINIYFSSLSFDSIEQARWEDVNATCIIEYAYAADTEDDALYEFAEKIRAALLGGFEYTRGDYKTKISTDNFEQGIVDGFAQVIFDLNYQIDTAIKMDNDNLDKMQDLGLDLTITENR